MSDISDFERTIREMMTEFALTELGDPALWVQPSKKPHIVTVQVDYWLPDTPSIFNEFIWQVEDIFPQIPRVHGFLNYWKDNIEAPIKDVYVAGRLLGEGGYRAADFEGRLQ